MNAAFAKDFIHFLLKSGNRHSVHSPFIYKLVNEVFKNNPSADDEKLIESIRTEMLNDKRSLQIEDHGAGHHGKVLKERTLSSIASSSVKKKKYCRLLYNLCLYYRPENIIELGTSLGISTLYLTAGNREARIITIEGSPSIAAVASSNFGKAGFGNIELFREKFETGLPRALNTLPSADLVYIDGNHTFEATTAYFNLCLQKTNRYSIIIVDDIYWSEGMKKAWQQICNHEKVSATVNIFMMGLVFLNPELSKEEFKIRY